MDSLIYVIYGLVQGLTEFLPVSSSGHLVIFQELFGIKPEGILLEIVLHIATLLAVVIFLRKHIRDIFVKLFKRDEMANGWMYVVGIIIATIPAGVIGILFEEQIEILFENVIAVGVSLLITGIIVILIPRLYRDEPKGFSWRNVFLISLVVGIFQGFAIMPGISRSGFTIFAGVLMGLSWRSSADFSFTISIPAILGAGLLETVKLLGGGFEGSLIPLLFGFISALISGLFALWILYKLLKKGRIFFLGYYCIVIGIIVIILKIV